MAHPQRHKLLYEIIQQRGILIKGLVKSTEKISDNTITGWIVITEIQDSTVNGLVFTPYPHEDVDIIFDNHAKGRWINNTFVYQNVDPNMPNIGTLVIFRIIKNNGYYKASPWCVFE